MASVFGNVIVFFEKIGLYEVVLPFLMVFTIVFAILEKTRIFGTEKFEGREFTKKNINSLVAFCTAFFVVASAQLVQIITQVSSQVVVLLLLSIFFLILVGSFHKEGAFSLEGEEHASWRNLFMFIMFGGIVLIFLNAIKTPAGVTWLEFGFKWLQRNITSGGVAGIISLFGLVIFVYWITRAEHIGEKKSEKKE